MRFIDRAAAAEELARRLEKYKNDLSAIIVGLPRGGMVVASRLADELGLPLDFLIVKKIGAPDNPELALGAVTESGEKYLDRDLIASVGVDSEYIEIELQRKFDEALERSRLYRDEKALPSFKGKTVILVDDGVATGATMLAAIESARGRGAKSVIVAIPVISEDAFEKMNGGVDRMIYLEKDSHLASVGEYYGNFPQIEDNEVTKLLKNAKDNFGDK